MRAWIAISNGAISGLRHYGIPKHDDASNRYLAFLRCGSRLNERQPHVCEVIHRNLAKSLGTGPIFPGIVEDFAESRRVVATRGTDIQVRALLGCCHHRILTSGLSEWRLIGTSVRQ